MNKKMKLTSVVAAMAIAASMSASAFATTTTLEPNGNIGGAVPTENGTEVWAGVVVDNPDMRIKVTVPTLFAFVVNGTVDDGKTGNGISVTDGSLLLPNVKVENVKENDPAAGQSTYDLTTTGNGSLTFANYSTYYTGTDYSGLEVKLNGSIKADVGAKWTPVATAPTTATGDKYKYRVTVNNNAFDTAADGGYGLATPITLKAPSEVAGGKNIDTTTKLAKTPYEEEVKFGVEVGGTRGDYQTVEASAKVGTIVWKVSTTQTTPPNT